MAPIKRIPYGISDFTQLRNENCYFVDKTPYLPLIEEMPNYLFLIRPRRFGKSLFLSMMQMYYDILQRDSFEKYFGDLWIGSHPTQLRNSFQVLYFDFSKAGCSLPGSDLISSFNEYCGMVINQFAYKYAAFYDADFQPTIKHIESAKAKLSYLEMKARGKGYPLYLIIDEYDNFTNVVLSEHGQKKFHDLTHASGFYREYFKQFKGMFDRAFFTGVSPFMQNDVFNEYNMVWDISEDKNFNAMMGFTEQEVRGLLHYYQENGMLSGGVESRVEEMKEWCGNYCFALESLNNERIFNCDLIHYYISNQIPQKYACGDRDNKNTFQDYDILKMLTHLDLDGTVEKKYRNIMDKVIERGEILVKLHSLFSTERITDIDSLICLLYCYGLLTVCGTSGIRTKMCIPNYYAREQYFSIFNCGCSHKHETDFSNP